MKNSKPIVVFTTFWDAEFMLDNKCCVSLKEDKLHIIRLNLINETPINYTVSSIALMHPDLTQLPLIKSQFDPFIRLDCFCPTYKILKQYKESKDWDRYTKEFHGLIRHRKEDIKSWVEGLKEDHIYFLCCWENTKKNANCHRRLLYDAFIKSNSLKDKATYLYRHGSKGYVRKASLYNEMEGYVSNDSIYQNDISSLAEILGSRGGYNPAAISTATLSGSLPIGAPVHINTNGEINDQNAVNSLPFGIVTESNGNQVTIQINSNAVALFTSMMDNPQLFSMSTRVDGENRVEGVIRADAAIERNRNE